MRVIAKRASYSPSHNTTAASKHHVTIQIEERECKSQSEIARERGRRLREESRDLGEITKKSRERERKKIQGSFPLLLAYIEGSGNRSTEHSEGGEHRLEEITEKSREIRFRVLFPFYLLIQKEVGIGRWSRARKESRGSGEITEKSRDKIQGSFLLLLAYIEGIGNRSMGYEITFITPFTDCYLIVTRSISNNL